MSIKTFFKKLFHREKTQPALPEVPIQEQPKSSPIPDIRIFKFNEMKTILDACHYGTLIDRNPDEFGYPKKKRAKDGWRDGKSHPFSINRKSYDVITDPEMRVEDRIDKTIKQYEDLLEILVKKYLLEEINGDI